MFILGKSFSLYAYSYSYIQHTIYCIATHAGNVQWSWACCVQSTHGYYIAKSLHILTIIGYLAKATATCSGQLNVYKKQWYTKQEHLRHKKGEANQN